MLDFFPFDHKSITDTRRLALLEQRLLLNPKDFDALLQKAILYYEPCHKTDEALIIFTSLIEEDPKNVDAYFWFAECLFDHIGDYQKAENLLKFALSIDPNRADCHSLLASVISLNSANENEVIFHFNKALELEPTWISPRISLASLLLRQGNLVEARKHALIAIEKIPEIIPHVEDSIKNHYEKLVTGRYYPDNKQNATELLSKIDLAISNKNKVN